jgi:hypothetical protein
MKHRRRTIQSGPKHVVMGNGVLLRGDEFQQGWPATVGDFAGPLNGARLSISATAS